MVFSFELKKQHQFNYGQAYVALSRVKAVTDLYILGDVNKKAIRADKRIEIEYERLRALQNFDDSSANITFKSSSSNTVITLLNIRSLKRHYLDVMHDNKIVESDVMAFTETGKKFFPEVNGFLVHLTKGELMLNILLLYRPKDMHPLLFCSNLENMVSNHEIRIILGDFNINVFNETDSLHLETDDEQIKLLSDC